MSTRTFSKIKPLAGGPSKQFLWLITRARTHELPSTQSVNQSIRTALELSSALAARNGVFVKTQTDLVEVPVSIDEIKLMHTIIDTILSSSIALTAGSTMTAVCELHLHHYTLGFSIATYFENRPVYEIPEDRIQNILERTYLLTQQPFAAIHLAPLQ